MCNLKLLTIRAILRVTLSCVALFFFAFHAMAQSSNSNYMFLLASGFLCDTGDSSTCPATAKANDGDSYELSGAGMFDVQNKSVKATGTFTHKSPSGNVLATGVWLATEVVSFDSYGAAPNALPRQSTGFGPRAMGAGRMLAILGSMPTGGLAVFRIRLLPIQGPRTNAVLQVNCTLGEVPRERSVEGIRLTSEKNNTEYSEEVGGRVMFLSMRPEVIAPAKTSQQDSTAETSEKPQ
jgi:hypothetical protein